MNKITGILVALLTLISTSSYASSFPYTGKFLSSDGSSLVGNTTITVGTRLYESPDGGLPFEVGTEQTVVVEDGIFQINVGPVDGIDLNQFSWLELVINGEALSPRRALNYTPLAIDSQRFSGMSSQEWQERFASLVSSNQDLGYLTSEMELIQASLLAQSAQISALETSQLDLGDAILLMDENIFQTILVMEALTGTVVNLEQGQTNLESQLGQLSINQLGSESAIANISNAVALLGQQVNIVNSTLDFHSSSISEIQTSLDGLSLLSSAGKGITVMDNGFTGINNGDPQATLDVAGSIEADSVSVDKVSAQTIQATDLNLGSAYGQAVQADELLVSGLNTPSHPFAVYTSYFNFEGFPFGKESTGQEFPSSQGEFVSEGSNLSSVEMYRETDPLLGAATFVITTSGYIGMGTTRPLYHLDIIGDLNVEGKIFVQGSPLGLGGSEEGAGTDSAKFGHFSNDAYGDYSFIGGGTDNYTERVDSASLGGTELVVTGVSAVAAGGYRNYAQAENSIVAGGQYNVSDGFNSAVIAGQQNLAISTNSFVAGGYYNEATGESASVIGGSVNTAAGFYSSVIGGAYNEVHGHASAVLGGSNNIVDGFQSGVLAGTVNQVTGNRSAAIGGVGNWVQGDDSLILGGSENYSYSNTSVVIGGAGIDNYANNNFIFSSSENSMVISSLQSHTAIFDVRRLGVGETAPIAKLHVTGNGTALNDASAELENLDHSGFTLLRLRVPGYSYQLGMGGPTATHNQNSVYIWDEVSSTTRMLINSAGYMGVSTDTPIAPLHVGGAMAFDNTTFDFDPGLDISFQGALIYNEGDFYAYNGQGWDRFLMEGGAAGYIQDFSGNTVVRPVFHRINFEVNGTQKMTLFEEGYLGLGTSKPAHMLHITTDVGAATILLDGATDAQVRISANSDSNFSNIDFAINGVTHGGLSYDHHLTDASEMLKFNVGGSDKVYVRGDGSLGLNTSNMSETLDVVGSAQITKYLCVGSDIDCGTVNPQVGGIYSEVTGVTGADYAEYFPSEGALVSGDLVGLNALTGKVRKYQSGDKLMGIASTNPGIIGGANRNPENHALVGLMGQLPVNQQQVQIEGRVVQTLDGVRVGLLLSDGTVYINLNPASEVQELRGKLKKQKQQIEELQDQVRFLMQKMK